MRTLDLTGIALDYAVTLIENPDALRYGVADWREQRRSKEVNGEYVHRYHQSWSQGGPILQANYMIVRPTEYQDGRWVAFIADSCPDGYLEAVGDTPLEALMRCYVLSRVGIEVDVPDELIGGTK